jgi:Uma2 family endonuclease
MTPSAETRCYTLEEYFEFERNSSEKFEYRDGRVVNLTETVGRAGGGVVHCLITANVVAALGARLKGGACRVYSSDLRIRIPRKVLWAYPDASVICGKPQIEVIPGIGETASNPQAIIEVLSPSTESYDRGDKFVRYREIPSLRDYVLVAQHEPRVEIFSRTEDGAWSFVPVAVLRASAMLRSLGLELPLAEVYAGVEFQPPPPPAAPQPAITQPTES